MSTLYVVFIFVASMTSDKLFASAMVMESKAVCEQQAIAVRAELALSTNYSDSAVHCLTPKEAEQAIKIGRCTTVSSGNGIHTYACEGAKS